MSSSVPHQISALFDPPDIGTCYVLPADDVSQNQGTGTASNPFRLPDGCLDGAFRMMNEKPNFHRLHLYPGEYFTGGRWALGQAKGQFARPFALTGEGPGQTIISLISGDRQLKFAGQNRFTGVLWAGTKEATVDGVTIADLAVHGNGLFAPDGLFVTGGIVIYGANARIRNVRVSGLKGSEKEGMEAFGILTNSAALSMENGGTRIEDCDVRNGTSDYFTGIYCGHVMGPGINASSIVRGCRVASLGQASNIAFSFNSRTTFRDCSASNVRYGFYNDTDAVNDVLIDGCTCDEVEYAALALTATNATQKVGVSLLNSRFRYAQNPKDAIGLVLWDKSGSGSFANILVENCSFESENLRFTVVSIFGSRIKNVRLVKNIIPDNAMQNLQAGSSGALSIAGNRSVSGIPIANLKPYPTS